MPLTAGSCERWSMQGWSSTKALQTASMQQSHATPRASPQYHNFSGRQLVPFLSRLDAMTGTVRHACLCRDPAELLASWLKAPLCFAPTPAARCKGRVSHNYFLVICTVVLLVMSAGSTTLGDSSQAVSVVKVVHSANNQGCVKVVLSQQLVGYVRQFCSAVGLSKH